MIVKTLTITVAGWSSDEVDQTIERINNIDGVNVSSINEEETVDEEKPESDWPDRFANPVLMREVSDEPDPRD